MRILLDGIHAPQIGDLMRHWIVTYQLCRRICSTIYPAVRAKAQVPDVRLRGDRSTKVSDDSIPWIKLKQMRIWKGADVNPGIRSDDHGARAELACDRVLENGCGSIFR